MNMKSSVTDNGVGEISTIDLLNEIAAGLSSIPTCGNAFPSNFIYTDYIIQTLADIGKKWRCDAYPDHKRIGYYREYLFDSSWRRDSSLVLAAESEWGRWNDVAYDFPKLLFAKAPLKLLITDSGCHGGNHRDQFKEKLERMLCDYPEHVSGERYIWIDVEGTQTGGRLFGFECKIVASGECRNAAFIRTSPESINYDFGGQNSRSVESVVSPRTGERCTISGE